MGKDISSQTARLFTLLHLLRREQFTTKAEMAQEIGRSERQVERLLIRLEELGFPVENLRGQGYRVINNGGSIPLRLTQDETWAVLLLQACSLHELGSSARASILSLTQRIRAQISPEASESLSEMEGLVGHSAPPNAVLPDVWQTVTEGLGRGLQLRFDYHKIVPDGGPIERRVDPWGLFVVGSAWYLHAYNHAHGKAHNYRLSRIHHPVLLSLKASRPAGYQAGENLFHRFDIGDGPVHQVRLHCNEMLSGWLVENPLHPQQESDGVVISLPVRNLDLFLDSLLAFSGLQRVEPDWLQQSLLERLRARLQHLTDSSAGAD